jgi:nucleotide-binding universal stress UspA family protein
MKKILVCLDFSEISKSVVDEACNFAEKTGAALNLVYVSPYRIEMNTHVVENQAQDTSMKMIKENREMERFESICRERGVEVDSDILKGNVIEALCAKAKEYEPDFIAIGSETTNAAVHMIKGSVGAGLLKNLKLPLLLIPCKTCDDE